MHRYDASFGLVITQPNATNKGFLTVPPVVWHNVDDDGLAGLAGLASAFEAEVKAHQNQGGDCDVQLVSKVVALDGGPIPQGANDPPQTYKGFTRKGISKVQRSGLRLLDKLVKMGEDHAAKKHK